MRTASTVNEQNQPARRTERALTRDYFELAVVVTMIAMGVVQFSIHQVIGVIPMGNSFVTASWAVPMARVMAPYVSSLRASIGIGSAHLDHMLVDVVLVRMM
jgi:hypothetical protein